MEKQVIIQLNKKFEGAGYEQNGVQYWMARDIQNLLKYEEWRNFLKVIEKAKQACLTPRQNISDHFVGVNKMINLGKGGQREVDDIVLTRYACYLIAQNGDPRKEQIAFAQTKKNNLQGEQSITGEHIKNNKDVRDLLGKSGIKPELLPPAEDIKRLDRQLKSDSKKIAKSAKVMLKEKL